MMIDDGNREVLSEILETRVSSGLEERAKRRRPSQKVNVGASLVAMDCARRAAYSVFDDLARAEKYWSLPQAERAKFRWPESSFDGRMQRVLRDGFTLEEKLLEDLDAAGFVLETRSRASLAEGRMPSQFGFSTTAGSAGRAYVGKIDGIVRSAPEGFDMETPAILEIKTANSKRWQDFVKNGAAKAMQAYVRQIWQYQGMMGLKNPALLVVYNKDTSTYACELVPFNESEFNALQDRAGALIEASSPEDVARGGVSPDDMVCRWCPWVKKCWTEVPERDFSVFAPSWMKRGGAAEGPQDQG